MTEYELEREVRDAIGEPALLGHVGDPVQHRRPEPGPVSTTLLHDLLACVGGALPDATAVVDGDRSRDLRRARRDRRTGWRACSRERGVAPRRPGRAVPRQVARGARRHLRDPEGRRGLRPARPGGAAGPPGVHRGERRHPLPASPARRRPRSGRSLLAEGAPLETARGRSTRRTATSRHRTESAAVTSSALADARCRRASRSVPRSDARTSRTSSTRRARPASRRA